MAFIAPGRRANDYAHTHARHAREAMTTEVVSVTRDTSLAEAADLMLRKHIKRLPITDAGRVVGMISRPDLLRALAPQLSKAEVLHPAPAAIQRSIIKTMGQESRAPKSGVRVKVAGRTVTLEGTVFSEAKHRAVFVIAENAEGVSQVIDHLVYIDPNSGMAFPTA
jgi:CBS domain-containing protein